MPESWRPAVGFDGYEVSDLGRVRSWLPWKGHSAPRVLLANPNDTGYPRVTLSVGGRHVYRKVHVLVTAAFLGPRPDGAETRHLDGDRTNSRLENLVYGSHADNMRDRLRHGTDRNAAKTECPQGHAYDYVDPIGKRGCRTCRTNHVRAWRARRHREALVA